MKNNRSTATLSAIWQRIDRIYCISLKDRPDRQASAQAQFGRVGLDKQVVFFLARRHPHNSEQGIYDSHQTCLKMGLDAGARHMLVFEDDVLFRPVDPNHLATGIDFFMQQTDSPLLFLGCLVSSSRPTPCPAVRRISYICMAHAYLVDARLARQIVDTPWQGIAFDDALRQWSRRHFVLYPAIAFQNNSSSDNTRQLKIERIRRLCGGMRIIQLANERFHRHKVAIITAHVVVATTAILWMLTR